MKTSRPTRRTYRTFASLAIVALASLFATASRADAACTPTLRAHLAAGRAALAGGANDAKLARAVDLASREIGSCDDRDLDRTYYALAAWKAYFAAARPGIDPNVARADARILRDRVAAYFRFGGATSDPRTYAALKEAVRDTYARDGLVYCSPERTSADCAIDAHVARIRDAADRARVAAFRGAARPRCAVPNSAAVAIALYPPDYPDAVRSQGVTGTTLVRVTIGVDGSARSPSIYKSSGNGFLDRSAMRAAQLTSYRAARRDCRPVVATYVFRSDFAP